MIKSRKMSWAKLVDASQLREAGSAYRTTVGKAK
jgi:hypothetical protein